MTIQCCFGSRLTYHANKTIKLSSCFSLHVYPPSLFLVVGEENNQWALSDPEDQRPSPNRSPNLINSSPYTLPVSHNSESIQFRKHTLRAHKHKSPPTRRLPYTQTHAYFCGIYVLCSTVIFTVLEEFWNIFKSLDPPPPFCPTDTYRSHFDHHPWIIIFRNDQNYRM